MEITRSTVSYTHLGAGGGRQAAGNAVKALDDLVHLHSFQQMGDAQQISRAAPCDLDITDGIIIIIHRDGIPFGAHTLGSVSYTHLDQSRNRMDIFKREDRMRR